MNSVILILKGFLIGLGKIIPGVSGSIIALCLGVYEKAINAITNFFKDLKKNILYLGLLGLGIVIAIIFFSNVIIYMLDEYYLYTIILFIGLICGTIPYIIKKVEVHNKFHLIYILLGLSLVYLVSNFKNAIGYMPESNILSFLYTILIGFIDAATMIIPGISGTAIFMMMGCYDFVLKIFSNPLAHLGSFGLFALGIIIGVIIMTKIVAYLLSTHKEPFYLLIIGFSLNSILYLIFKIIPLINFANIITCILLYMGGFILSLAIEKL